MLNAKLLLPFVAFCLLSCQPMVDNMADDIAAQVSDKVARQVNTAVAVQVGTAVAAAQTPVPTQDSRAQIVTGPVTRVVDGDTIDVLIDGKNIRVRYLQVNTPERDEPCYKEATAYNAELVAGKTVRLVPDTELLDRYDRWLRFVYVGDLSVSRALVEAGYAEVVLYPPNDAHYEAFVTLEAAAADAGRGCHPTGIFDDGSTRR